MGIATAVSTAIKVLFTFCGFVPGCCGGSGGMGAGGSADLALSIPTGIKIIGY
jgi:hypothetical protein